MQSVDQLFDEIPQNLRVKSLAGVPEALSEMEIGRLMTERARTDGSPNEELAWAAVQTEMLTHHVPLPGW